MAEVVELRILPVLRVEVSRSFERRAKGYTVVGQSENQSTFSGGMNKTHLLRDSSTKLPTYSGLDGKRNVLHLDLTGSPGVFGVHQSIRKDL